jgi:predicted SprT family Zn-dependent metalloprotease
MRNAVVLARELMRAHGLLPPAWDFRLTDSRSRAGRCRYWPASGAGVVELSRAWGLANGWSEEFVRGTVLHEIAHALVGPARGHDEVWAAKCAEIGGSPGRFEYFFTPPPHRFHATCPCGARFARDRPPLPVPYQCPVCGSTSVIWQGATHAQASSLDAR